MPYLQLSVVPFEMHVKPERPRNSSLEIRDYVSFMTKSEKKENLIEYPLLPVQTSFYIGFTLF